MMVNEIKNEPICKIRRNSKIQLSTVKDPVRQCDQCVIESACLVEIGNPCLYFKNIIRQQLNNVQQEI